MTDPLFIGAYDRNGRSGYFPVAADRVLAYRPVAWPVYSRYGVLAPDARVELRPAAEAADPADRGVLILKPDRQMYQELAFIPYSPHDLMRLALPPHADGDERLQDVQDLRALFWRLGHGKIDLKNYLTQMQKPTFAYADVASRIPSEKTATAAEFHPVARAAVRAFGHDIYAATPPELPGWRFGPEGSGGPPFC